jgi:hypothetical protein
MKLVYLTFARGLLYLPKREAIETRGVFEQEALLIELGDGLVVQNPKVGAERGKGKPSLSCPDFRSRLRRQEQAARRSGCDSHAIGSIGVPDTPAPPDTIEPGHAWGEGRRQFRHDTQEPAIAVRNEYPPRLLLVPPGEVYLLRGRGVMASKALQKAQDCPRRGAEDEESVIHRTCVLGTSLSLWA